jgi:alpha-methylacyl-CoA racemase
MKRQSALSGCRVLDLTDSKGMLCPRLLADMGADVIRIEKPSSTESRFYWENLGKRVISLDIELKPENFKRLVKTSDVLVESFAPGYLPFSGRVDLIVIISPAT